MIEMVVLGVVAIAVGLLIGWLLGGRGAGGVQAERDLHRDNFKAAVIDLESVVRERDTANVALASLRAEQGARDEAFELRLAEMREAKDALAAQFSEIGGKILGEAQEAFLKRADDRFKQAEEATGLGIKALIQPVHERLQKYEDAVGKVEAERRDAFGELRGQIEAMRVGTDRISGEAAKIVNALRNAPKARGNWGEQQLKNVLENCGLSEYSDFRTEVSAEGEDGGRLRPDVIIRVPGGKSLVIDAKVSLNAYQDAFGAVDEVDRATHLATHANSMRTHVNALGNKSYWSQFADAPDYVIMFVPGEHFLSAALEHDTTLWDFAFDKRVLLATPTNLIAIARTVSAVWRQEMLAKEARRIGELGKELYERLAVTAQHLRVVGSGLSTAVTNYNKFVGSYERNVLSSGRKLAEMNIDTPSREMGEVPAIEALTRYQTDDPGPSGEECV